MDNQLIWTDEFNIGITLIDEEHQRLFTIINRLLHLRQKRKRTKEHVKRGLSILKNMQ